MIETTESDILWNAAFEREEDEFNSPYEKTEEEQYNKDLELFEQFAKYFKPSNN